jgi:PAS domain S-box-containing protein
MSSNVPPPAGPRILIVDDDLKILEVTRIILEGEGYQVEAAGDGQHVREYFSEHDADLVLLDIILPDIDGYTLCKEIKSSPRTQDIPVILLTSLDGVDNKVRGLDVGANDYLVKPFLQKELLARIRSHLRGRESAREVRSLYRQAQQESENLQALVGQRTHEIENQKRLMECIIDSLPLGIYVTDKDFSVVTWNRKRETGILGIPREQVVGRNIFSVFPSLIQDKLKNEFIEVMAHNQPFETETVSYVSGEKRYYHLRKIPMEMEPGTVSHVITLADDITERKRLEESVYTNGKLASLGRLSAGVAHELNNPLAAIAGCVEGLISRAQDPELRKIAAFEDFPGYLKIIDDEIQRCKGIINNLLEFSRSREALQQSINVNEVLEQTLMLLSHHKSFKKIQVKKDLDPQLPSIVGNGGELKQVFVAMAINAMDAMNQSGELTLSSGTEIRNEQTHVCISFQDTGVGIPPENLNKIFDPFFTTKPVGQGVGLGLSICYGIVRSHNGFIKVSSEEGHGTLFQIYIPVTSVREPVA